MEQREQKANSFALCRVVTEEDEVNALEPGTVMPIHRHRNSSETVVIVRGSLIERFYDEDGNITE